MKLHALERRQFIPRPIEEVFAFFSRAENLETMTPPFLNFRILSVDPPELRRGTRIYYRLALHGLIPMRWTSEITRWEPPFGFVDEQVSGPYRVWHHEHRFDSSGGGTDMCDRVEYALPLGPLGVVAHGLLVHRDLKCIFDFRARRIRELFT